MMSLGLLIRFSLGGLMLALVLCSQLLAQQLAFVSDRDGNYEIYLSDDCGSYEIWADFCFGSDAANITNHPGADTHPRWSPDGERLLFLSDRTGNRDIYVIYPVGRFLHNITNSLADENSPQWSPDNSRILYRTSATPRHPHGAVYVISSGGGSAKLLTDANDVITTKWSPNGQFVLFSTVGYLNHLFVVNADGTALRQLWDNPGDAASDPQWSPDSTEILVSSDNLDNYQVYAVKLDGERQSLGDGYSPKWTADGRRIVFQTDRNGHEETYIMDADGRNRAALSAAQERVTEIFPGEGGTRSGDSFPVAGDWDLQVYGSADLTVRPKLDDGGIVLANLAPTVTTVAPLSIVTIFGRSISDVLRYQPQLDAEGKVARKLGATCVEIGGERAPIFAVTPTQINLQIPSTAPFGTVSVVVIRNCDQFNEARSAASVVAVEEAAPGFFLYPPYESEGLIAARFSDGYAAVAPEGMFSDNQGPSRPAKPGDIILLFGTGWGRTEADLATGELGVGADRSVPSTNPIVTFGGIPLASEDVLYVGATPDAAGLYQLAMRVPATALPGPNQVVLTVYGKSTPVGPVVPVTGP